MKKNIVKAARFKKVMITFLGEPLHNLIETLDKKQNMLKMRYAFRFFKRINLQNIIETVKKVY